MTIENQIESNQFNSIVHLLIEDGLLKSGEADYAYKVTQKIQSDRAHLDVIKELGYVTDEDIRKSLKKNQGKIRIGDLLNGLGYLSKTHLENALAIQKEATVKKKLGDILIDHHYISDDTLTEVISIQMDIPIVEFVSQPPDPELIGIGDLETFKTHGFFPVKKRKIMSFKWHSQTLWIL